MVHVCAKNVCSTSLSGVWRAIACFQIHVGLLYHRHRRPRVNLVWMEINEKDDSYNMGRLAILNLQFSLVWHTETVSGKG